MPPPARPGTSPGGTVGPCHRAGGCRCRRTSGAPHLDAKELPSPPLLPTLLHLPPPSTILGRFHHPDRGGGRHRWTPTRARSRASHLLVAPWWGEVERHIARVRLGWVPA